MPEKFMLRQMQSLPLTAKIHMSQARIREWYNHFDGDVCVSFSGGKDSTVLANLVRDLYPNVPVVFVNTGLEYPELQKFAKQNDAEFVYPKMMFSEVISTYGYPIISKEISEAIYFARKICNGSAKQKRKTSDRKRGELLGKRLFVNDDECQDKTGWISKNNTKQANTISSMFNKKKWLPLCTDTDFNISHMCCHVMKKYPIKSYLKKNNLYPYIGTLAEESRLREQAWIKHGCNAFDSDYKTSQPMSFWTEQDVLQYIYEQQIEIASVYGSIVATDENGYEYEPCMAATGKLKCTGCKRTGCIFCGFSVHLETKENRETKFQRLAKTHPRQYDYCMNGGQWVDNPKYDPVAPKMDGDWVNWNPKKIWVPSKQGLGMKKVFDDCNKLYGKDFIRYE